MHHQRYGIVLAGLTAILCGSGPSAAQSGAPATAPGKIVTTPDQKAPDAVPAANDAQAARVSIDTNAACTLRIGGVLQEPLLIQGEPRSLVVPSGATAIECTSPTVPQATLKLAVDAAPGATKSVWFDLAPFIVSAKCAGKPATLADLGGGILRHCVTRADWTQNDSGPGGLNWYEGRAWCAKKGDGWELPGTEELYELVDRSGQQKTSCGSRHICHVSPLFRLTAPSIWSSQVTHPGMAMNVLLLAGGFHPTAQDENHDYHALCIHRTPR